MYLSNPTALVYRKLNSVMRSFFHSFENLVPYFFNSKRKKIIGYRSTESSRCETIPRVNGRLIATED
jgi:hypothetical protein